MCSFCWWLTLASRIITQFWYKQSNFWYELLKTSRKRWKDIACLSLNPKRRSRLNPIWRTRLNPKRRSRLNPKRRSRLNPKRRSRLNPKRRSRLVKKAEEKRKEEKRERAEQKGKEDIGEDGNLKLRRRADFPKVHFIDSERRHRTLKS